MDTNNPIAYASRATNTVEQVCSCTTRSGSFGVCTLLCTYLGIRSVCTDHRALVSVYILYIKSQTKGLLPQRYLRLSSPFLPNLTLEHKAGVTNQAVDATCFMERNVTHGNRGATMDKVQPSQRDDSELLVLIEYLE